MSSLPRACPIIGHKVANRVKAVDVDLVGGLNPDGDSNLDVAPTSRSRPRSAADALHDWPNGGHYAASAEHSRPLR